MALWQVTYKGRTRVMHNEGPLSFPGSLSDLWVKRFKYKYENVLMPPTLATIDGKRYLMPDWKVVNPKTTLDDIEWIKPQPKKTEIETFEFKSSSSGSMYTTKKYTKPNGEIKFTCSCPGFYRAKDRDKGCKHMQEIRAKI